MTYGARLDTALLNAGQARKALALALDCKVQAIGMVISGNGYLSVPNHAKAARFLQVNSHWLATGEGAMARLSGPSIQDTQLLLTLLSKTLGALHAADRQAVQGLLASLVANPHDDRILGSLELMLKPNTTP